MLAGRGPRGQSTAWTRHTTMPNDLCSDEHGSPSALCSCEHGSLRLPSARSYEHGSPRLPSAHTSSSMARLVCPLLRSARFPRQPSARMSTARFVCPPSRARTSTARLVCPLLSADLCSDEHGSPSALCRPPRLGGANAPPNQRHPWKGTTVLYRVRACTSRVVTQPRRVGSQPRSRRCRDTSIHRVSKCLSDKSSTGSKYGRAL